MTYLFPLTSDCAYPTVCTGLYLRLSKIFYRLHIYPWPIWLVQSNLSKRSVYKMNENKDFGMELKSYRKAREMSQADFAAFLGIPVRTYQNYESGHRYPRNMEVVNKIAVALGITAEDLLGAAGGYIVEANEKGGSRDRRRMEQMVTQLSAMFAGGEIDQESKDAAMAALNAVYWKHKEENRERYTTKKNKGTPSDT